MEFILLGLILGGIGWHYYTRTNNNDNIRFGKRAAIEAEFRGSGNQYEETQTEFCAIAKYSGGNSRFPTPAIVTVTILNDKVYIRSIRNPKQPSVDFIVPIKAISDFSAAEANSPYMMTLNIASIVSNAMTRQQMGFGARLTYTDDINVSHIIWLEQFQMASAQDFIQRIYQTLARQRKKQASPKLPEQPASLLDSENIAPPPAPAA